MLLFLLASLLVSGRAVDVDAVRSQERAATSACASGERFVGQQCVRVSACQPQQRSATAPEVELRAGRAVGVDAIELLLSHAAASVSVRRVTFADDAGQLCAYPGPSWRKAVDVDSSGACRDLYISNIAWASGCGLARQENGTHVWFTGSATVSVGDGVSADTTLTRHRLQVDVFLQDLELPALITLEVEVLDAAFPNDIPMHKKWQLVTAAKHFHSRATKKQ